MEFRDFVKNPNFQRMKSYNLEIQTKLTGFLAEFSAISLLLNSSDFMGVKLSEFSKEI